MLAQLVAVEEPDDGLRVPDVDREQHAARLTKPYGQTSLRVYRAVPEKNVSLYVAPELHRGWISIAAVAGGSREPG